MSPGPETDGAARVRSAVERTLEAGTARLRQTMRSPVGTVTATGTVDFVRRRATAVMTLPPHPDAPDPDSPTDVTMIIDGATTYTEVIDRPGRWIVDRLADAGEAVSAGDPGLLLDVLRGTVSATQLEAGDPEVGDPEVGDPEAGDPEVGDPEAGDPEAGGLGARGSTVFDVEIDLDRAIERAPDDLRRPLREALDSLLRDRDPQRARVGLDGDGRIRSISLALVVTAARPVDRLEVELLDLGADVDITPPDPGSILDADELAALGAELRERFGDELFEDEPPTPPTGPDDGVDGPR